MLLILTSTSDLAADFLIVRLLERGLPYMRFDSERHESLDSTFEVSDGSVARALRSGDKQADLSAIRAVWYRRSIAPMPSQEIEQSQQRFAGGELAHYWRGLFLDDQVRWVNPMDRVWVGEHKLYQLRLARSLGLTIPKSLVSRRNDALASFATTVGHVICKPIYHGLFVEPRARYSAYTHRVSATDFPSGVIQPCPVFLQEEITRVADVRITLIGQASFSVRIRAEGQDYVDWRPSGLALSYSLDPTPDAVLDRCRAMMERLGLLYAAFDFIVTPGDEYVFLEVNPTGEWAWLEDRMDLPMRDAFCRLFFAEAH